jgi:hypothetical protein
LPSRPRVRRGGEPPREEVDMNNNNNVNNNNVNNNNVNNNNN